MGSVLCQRRGGQWQLMPSDAVAQQGWCPALAPGSPSLLLAEPGSSTWPAGQVPAQTLQLGTVCGPLLSLFITSLVPQTPGEAGLPGDRAEQGLDSGLCPPSPGEMTPRVSGCDFRGWASSGEAATPGHTYGLWHTRGQDKNRLLCKGHSIN